MIRPVTQKPNVTAGLKWPPEMWPSAQTMIAIASPFASADDDERRGLHRRQEDRSARSEEDERARPERLGDAALRDVALTHATSLQTAPGRRLTAPRATFPLMDRFGRLAVGLGASVLAVAAVTGVVYGLESVAPTVSLGALYLFAIVPIAIFFGLGLAVVVSVASMLTFNFLFLPPLYTFTLADSQNWVALAIYLVTAIVVSELTARARRRAREAEQREREEALLAELATTFLEGRDIDDELDGIAAASARRARRRVGAHRARPAAGSAARGVALRAARGRDPGRDAVRPGRLASRTWPREIGCCRRSDRCSGSHRSASG